MSAGDYFDRVNPELLKLIPPDAKTVLEIGCGAGALCAAYRRMNPGVEWEGIDANADALKIAQTRGVVTIHVDLNESLPAGFDEEYDCLILGDVLEHLRDPWEALKWAAFWLKPGSQCLACIPNIGHWTVIRGLLNGEWEYQDEGLLDRTHLRFFTLKSIRAMFEQAGLQIFECCGRQICNEGAKEWADSLWPTDSESPIADDWLVYQWVIRARKPTAIHVNAAGEPSGIVIQPDDPDYHHIAIIPKLHIHAVTAEDCCARPRIHEPFAMLGTIPGVKCTTRNGTLPSCDILIQQRHREFSLIAQTIYLNSFLIIAEVDDLPEAIGMDPMVLKATHAIQCSTEALAEVCRRYNPNVMVFENQIAGLPPLDNMDGDGNVHIFYGAQNRQNDWKPIMPALNRVLAEFGKRVSVIVVHDREFYDALDPSTDRHFFPFCEYDRYCGLLRECDIALLPLEDTPFNRCKSDIKFLECAAEGVAVLAGMTVYSDFLKDNPDNIFSCGLYAGEDDFTELLELLINDARVRRNLVENAYAYVRDNRQLSQHYRKRYDWYLDLLKHKQRLTDELLARVPELSERLVTA